MKSRNWDYLVEGTDGSGAEWSVKGALSAVDEERARKLAQQLAFQELTGGRATFGKPGDGGCRGPYKITKLEVKERAP
jgi:hypothetical protein